MSDHHMSPEEIRAAYEKVAGKPFVRTPIEYGQPVPAKTILIRGLIYTTPFWLLLIASYFLK